MVEKIIIASQNSGKLREIQAYLTDVPQVELSGAAEMATTRELDPEETGTTFAQNAFLKALAFASASQLPVLADDSGLNVAALDNFPGIYSARWLEGSDQDRVQGLLDKLTTQASANRQAFFTAVFCYFNPYQKFSLDSIKEQLDEAQFLSVQDEPNLLHAQFFVGICRGRLATHPQGKGGFGYDPIFIPDAANFPSLELAASYQNQTFGQIPLDIKNITSHRAHALRKFKAFLQSQH